MYRRPVLAVSAILLSCAFRIGYGHPTCNATIASRSNAEDNVIGVQLSDKIAPGLADDSFTTDVSTNLDSAPEEQVDAESAADQSNTKIVTDTMLKFALSLNNCNGLLDCRADSVLSPLSISTTLAMLLAGTSGSSSDQLRKALGYDTGRVDSDDNVINEAYRKVMKWMREMDRRNDSAIVLKVANGLFSEKSLLKEYSSKARRYFFSEIRPLDAQLDPQGAVDSINQWISNQTSNRINNMLQSLAPDTKLVMANAVYFNANWDVPFNADYTHQAPFTVSQSEVVQVAMMTQQAEVKYAENSDLGCKMIAIPYRGGELSMHLLVPTEKRGIDSLSQLEERLTHAKLADLIGSMEDYSVSYQVPKFRIRERINLKETLQSMGVTDLFYPDKADMSGMTVQRGVAIDDIVHQTFIEVTESGTEAAAATVVLTNRDGAAKYFTADQPFLFYIIDKLTQAVVFSGRVVRPESGSEE